MEFTETGARSDYLRAYIDWVASRGNHPFLAARGLPDPTRTAETPENLYWVDGEDFTVHPVIGESGPFLVLAGDECFCVGYLEPVRVGSIQ